MFSEGKVRQNHISTISQFYWNMCLSELLCRDFRDIQINMKGPSHDKTNQMACAPSEYSNQPGHPPSLISLYSALSEKLKTQAFFKRTGKTLIRLGGCPGWSESLLSAHAILLVLSWGGPNHDSAWWACHVTFVTRRFTCLRYWECYSQTDKPLLFSGYIIWHTKNFLPTLFTYIALHCLLRIFCPITYGS